MFIACLVLAFCLLALGIGGTFRLIGVLFGVAVLGCVIYALGWGLLLGLLSLL